MGNGRPDLLAHSAIGRDGGHDDDHTMAGKQLADETDAPDVDVAILLTEAQAFREVSPDHISIKHFYFGAGGAQPCLDDLGDGALARAGKTGKPKDKTLMHAGFPEPLRAAHPRSAGPYHRR